MTSILKLDDFLVHKDGHGGWVGATRLTTKLPCPAAQSGLRGASVCSIQCVVSEGGGGVSGSVVMWRW